MILIVTRTFTWRMRRIVLHADEVAQNVSEPIDGKHEKDVLAACTGCFEYDMHLHSQPSLPGLLACGELFSHGTRVSCHPH